MQTEAPSGMKRATASCIVISLPPATRAFYTWVADADKGPSASLARARQALNVRKVRLGLPRPRRLAYGPFSAPGCRGSSRTRRTPIRAHLLRWRGRGTPSTYGKYASGCRALAGSHMEPSRRPTGVGLRDEADGDKGPSASLARARHALDVRQVRLEQRGPRRVADGPFSARLAGGCGDAADAEKGSCASVARGRQARNVRQVRLGLPRPRRVAAGPFSVPDWRGVSGRGGRREGPSSLARGGKPATYSKYASGSGPAPPRSWSLLGARLAWVFDWGTGALAEPVTPVA